MTRLALQVVDLGFGDSGKGTLVDYLVRSTESDLVIRFNGGPQAGHNVVLPDGRHHTFAQFGSGSFVPGVKTLLSRCMLIEPYAMLNEAAHLEEINVGDVFSRAFIDERCLVITPPHQIINRLRERARGVEAHGTCGMGVGECVSDAIADPEMALRAHDLRNPGRIRAKLEAVLERMRAIGDLWRSIATPGELRVLDDPSWIDVALDRCREVARRAAIVEADDARKMLGEAKTCIFEGAQGVLLDEVFGFSPHTTWSTTTFENADALLTEAGSDAQRQRIGIMRTYMTRHGAGPLPTEAADLRASLEEKHNHEMGCQGTFRRGLLDLVLLRYAISLCGGVDALAVTHLDQLPMLPKLVCDEYELGGIILKALNSPDHNGQRAEFRASELGRCKPRYRATASNLAGGLLEDISNALHFPVAYASHGPTHADKVWLE